MNRTVFCLLLLTALSISMEAQDLHVMTFNLRYNNPGDGINAWPNRKQFAATQVAFHETDILGVQEALNGQIKDLLEQLPGFAFTGVGRDDGGEKGEYSAILYNTRRVKLLKSETFWLSETPTVPGSKSWDAAITRIVTWALFKDLTTKKEFYFFNTHFDHIGKVARRSSAELLLQKVSEIAGKTPAIITGDFNAHPDDEPIRVIMDMNNPLHFTDSKSLSIQPHYGPSGTFNAFQAKEQSDQPIDYVFLKGKFRVLQHATLSQTWEGRFSSDHFPVFARILIL